MGAFRTPLVALLILRLQIVALFWACGSYVVGLLLYYVSVIHFRIVKWTWEDRIITKNSVHLVFSHIIALEMCFIAFPYAPNRNIRSWWFGYLISETKIILENIAFCIMVTLTHEMPGSELEQAELIFYSAVFCVSMLCILNFIILAKLHMSANKHFCEGRAYTNRQISKLFKQLCSRYPEELSKEDKHKIERRKER